MFLILTLILASIVVNIEAVDQEVQVSILNSNPTLNYQSELWKNHVSELFAQSMTKKTIVSIVLRRLFEIHHIEQSHKLQLDVDTLKRSSKIRDYFMVHESIVNETSLFRKRKFVSENLLDIIGKLDGCLVEDFSKLDRLSQVFRERTRIRITIATLRPKKLRYCWPNYRNLTQSIVNLIGHRYETVSRLIRVLNESALNDYSQNRYDAKPESIELLSFGIAVYMIALGHPDLEDIPARNMDQMEELLEEIYKSEVEDPCTYLCNMSNSARQYFSQLKQSTSNELKNKFERSESLEKTLDSCCNIASFAYASLRARIWRHFLNLKTAPYS